MDADIANGWIEAHFSEWLRGLAPRVERLACTGAVLTMPVTPAILGPDGTIARPALAALADTAMVIACAGHLRGYTPVTATNLEMQLLRPALGTSLEVTATVVRGSKTLVFTRAAITAEPSGKEVAAATATYMVA